MLSGRGVSCIPLKVVIFSRFHQKTHVKASIHQIHFKIFVDNFITHPWAGEDFSLKIDVDDQTIWKSTLEL